MADPITPGNGTVEIIEESLFVQKMAAMTLKINDGLKLIIEAFEYPTMPAAEAEAVAVAVGTAVKHHLVETPAAFPVGLVTPLADAILPSLKASMIPTLVRDFMRQQEEIARVAAASKKHLDEVNA